MQQLKKIEHKNEDEVKRDARGDALQSQEKSTDCRTLVFYVLSESRSDNTYYFVKYNLSDSYCSCPDSSMRQMKCKHIWSIEYAIRLATVKDVKKLPIEVKNEVAKSYTEDGQYDF